MQISSLARPLLRCASLFVVLSPMAAMARLPPNPQALKECAQAGRQFVEMTNGEADMSPGVKNVRRLAQSERFAKDCAKEVSPEVRTCLISAKTPRAWTACLKAKKPVETDPPKAGLCTRPAGKYGPVIVTQAEYESRRGTPETRFSQLTQTPIEVCGVPASQARLRALTCDDGSTPFASNVDVAKARVGNIGQGGRCKAMIDHYQVKCPEKTYDAYVDMYWCRPGLWPHY